MGFAWSRETSQAVRPLTPKGWAGWRSRVGQEAEAAMEGGRRVPGDGRF